MRILYVEPFEAGSHAAFTRALTGALPARWTVLTLPGRHWKWRMRGSAAWAALDHREALEADHDLVFVSSYVPLAELVGLAPQLARCPRVLYFHENQLAYPDRESSARDHHFGFTQLVSCLAATRCVFNSRFNLESFLEAGRSLLERMPDAVPCGWIERIAARSEVLPVPLPLPIPPPPRRPPSPDERALGPIVLWNHRWEFDKNPEGFFSVLRTLRDRGVAFRVIVCGQRFSRWPVVFDDARRSLGARVVHFGYVESRAEYEALLSRADIAISTAHHEFFGVSMIEAAHFGALTLVPDRLAYPEVFPPSCRYHDERELARRLTLACERFARGETLVSEAPDLGARFGTEAVVGRYAALFEALVRAHPAG
jgi:glycosyltransferase involved in cell wall biosynthesis